MIRLLKYENLSQFKEEITGYLEQDEVVNNLPLGVLKSAEKTPLLMAVVRKDEEIGWAILQTHPDKIIFSKAASFLPDELRLIAEQMHHEFESIPGLIGDRKLIVELSGHLSKLRGVTATVEMNQGIYKLEKVKRKIGSNGKLRTLKEQEHGLVKEWVYQFCLDVNLPITIDEADTKADELIQKGRLWGWEIEGEIVSMANASRPTERNINVNFVYTPIEYRKKGFASDCVAALSQMMLHQGYQTTSLYTDLSNPTSNKIYQEIGYEWVADSVVMALGE
ncbi:GNAT family N-acetyltransferase [Mesobacillus boroniphilus]|uniref:GNAT family N-acetyltransferase n=1 Tax=Mesobacillus boroniphilus TaxID=308892 RepID=A0A944CPG2_9BACI|nr:GNAT family N-acetyltransferase [Mesobacillus boroniphilus]MBS8266450.1 GNAT family N-acetyltransferase [Mesobacillus boroniphilus]